MMRRILFLLTVPIVLAVCSCAPLNSSRQRAEDARQVAEEISKFYENASDSYFFIGWEYFTLAEEMKKAGRNEKSQEYAFKARIYTLMSENMKRMAVEARASRVMGVSGGGGM